MESPFRSVAAELCGLVDWDRPDLKGGPAHRAWRAGDAETAAAAFVRHLRARRRPRMGYSAGYVAAVRRHATASFRREARATIRRLRAEPLLGSTWPDGRGTLFSVRPEVLQVAGAAADFLHQARQVADGRAGWEKGAIHTIMNLLRYVQAVWPLAECPDEALVPVLAFVAVKTEAEWTWTRRWNEAMLGSQGHNWWVAQHGATWKAGLLFPEIKGLARFQALVPEWVEREIRTLGYPDGFTRECSVAYHIGTTDLFLDIARLARLNGIRLSPAFGRLLRRWGEVEWKLMQPDGNYPAFGDCFNAEPLIFHRLKSVAALLGIPEAKHLAERTAPVEKSPFGRMLVDRIYYPSVGENLAPAYRRLRARAPDTLDTCLPDGGLHVMRSGWDRRADYAAIESGPRGNVVSSHGHGALLDLMLCARGRAILVGNGKGPDVGMDEPRRLWRVKSASHSVATVDGEDHVPLRSIYRFARAAAPAVDAWIGAPRFAYFSGVHEAYERLERKVPAGRRKLFYLRGAYWILVDRFTAAAEEDEHVYRQHFQVQPAVRLEGGRAVTAGRGGNLLFCPVPGADGEASVAPCPWPLDGYFNPHQLVFTRPARGSTLLVTLLVPFSGGRPPAVEARLAPVEADGRALTPWEATGLEIAFRGRRHLYVDLHMHWTLPWHCAGQAGTARLFHSAAGLRPDGALAGRAGAG